MMKSVGERDMGIQEVMHQILSLKLYRSSFKVIIISLENSRRCKLSSTEITQEESDLERYAERLTLSKTLENTNLVDFFANFEIKDKKLVSRKEVVIIRTIPNFSSNPESNNYDHCKYQLLKYRPWHTNPNNAWDCDEMSDNIFVLKWQSFLQSDLS